MKSNFGLQFERLNFLAAIDFTLSLSQLPELEAK